MEYINVHNFDGRFSNVQEMILCKTRWARYIPLEVLQKYTIISLRREWYQNFSEECPEGKLDKERILNIYAQIAPLGNAKDFVDQIFRIFDEDGNGTIDFKEFMIATDMTESGTPEEKLRWAFKVGKNHLIIFVCIFRQTIARQCMYLCTYSTILLSTRVYF